MFAPKNAFIFAPLINEPPNTANPNGNDAGSFLPGAPSGQANPWQMYGTDASGNYDGTTVVPYSGATTDVAAIISGYMSFPVAGNYTFQVVNDADQPLVRAGKLLVVEYATETDPDDTFTMTVRKLGDVGSTPVSLFRGSGRSGHARPAQASDEQKQHDMLRGCHHPQCTRWTRRRK